MLLRTVHYIPAVLLLLLLSPAFSLLTCSYLVLLTTPASALLLFPLPTCFHPTRRSVHPYIHLFFTFQLVFSCYVIPFNSFLRFHIHFSLFSLFVSFITHLLFSLLFYSSSYPSVYYFSILLLFPRLLFHRLTHFLSSPLLFFPNLCSTFLVVLTPTCLRFLSAVFVSLFLFH